MTVQESESKPKPIVGGISPPYSADKGRPPPPTRDGFPAATSPGRGQPLRFVTDSKDYLCAGSHVAELKDAKAKAGSAVNRSPDLTGDIDTLGAPAEACPNSRAFITVRL